MVWIPIASASSWIDSDPDRATLASDPTAFFAARYNCIVAKHDNQLYLLCRDTPETRFVPGAVSRVQQVDAETAAPAVGFELDDKAAELFGAFTENNVGRSIAVLVNGRVYTAPKLRSRISRSCQIRGHFPPDELNKIVDALNSPHSVSFRIAVEPGECDNKDRLVSDLRSRGP
jgi:hypothetical protein